MNPKIICLLAIVTLALSATIFAAGAKTYQVTGTVLEMTGSRITVQKGTERLEIDLDPTIKTSGDVKVGSTVTVTYVMSATKVEGSGVSAATTSSPKLGATAPAAAAAAETTPAVPSSAPTP